MQTLICELGALLGMLAFLTFVELVVEHYFA